MKTKLSELNRDLALPSWVETKTERFYQKQRELLKREKKARKVKAKRKRVEDLYKEKQIRHTLTFNGRTQSLIDWCIELKIQRSTMYYRMRKGWSIEKIFFQGKYPTKPMNDVIEEQRIDEGVESWQFIMTRRGLSFKEERLLAYKQLKIDYETFRKQGLQVAA